MWIIVPPRVLQHGPGNVSGVIRSLTRAGVRIASCMGSALPLAEAYGPPVGAEVEPPPGTKGVTPVPEGVPSTAARVAMEMRAVV